MMIRLAPSRSLFVRLLAGPVGLGLLTGPLAALQPQDHCGDRSHHVTASQNRPDGAHGVGHHRSIEISDAASPPLTADTETQEQEGSPPPWSSLADASGTWECEHCPTDDCDTDPDCEAPTSMACPVPDAAEGSQTSPGHVGWATLSPAGPDPDPQKLPPKGLR